MLLVDSARSECVSRFEIFSISSIPLFITTCPWRADQDDRWVKTTNGQNFADSIGVESPPMSLEESVAGVLKQVCHLPSFLTRDFQESYMVRLTRGQIDEATRSTISGTFVSYDGSTIQW